MKAHYIAFSVLDQCAKAMLTNGHLFLEHAAAIGQHAQRLGEEVALADDRMQAQLQQKFDHRVGTLTPVSPSTVVPASAGAGNSAAREFRELIARPGGMRQIVIANEILRRPEERW